MILPPTLFDRVSLNGRSPKNILSQSTLNGQLTKWTELLQQYDIDYVPQKVIKGQALTDFLVAHHVLDGSTLSTDLVGEESMKTGVHIVENVFQWSFRSPKGEKQQGTQITK